MTGDKYDSGKAKMHLIDCYFIEGMAQVMTAGAEKYAEENWRKGISFNKIISSLRRHLLEIEKGIDYDSETGFQHAYHIACNAMFLSYYILNCSQFDDRHYKIKAIE